MSVIHRLFWFYAMCIRQLKTFYAVNDSFLHVQPTHVQQLVLLCLKCLLNNVNYFIYYFLCHESVCNLK